MGYRRGALVASAAIMSGLLVATLSTGTTAPAWQPMATTESESLLQPLELEGAPQRTEAHTTAGRPADAETTGYLSLPAFDQALRRLVAAVALPPTAPLGDAWASAPMLYSTTLAAVQTSTRDAAPPQVTAHNAVVLDEQSLGVLYDKGAHERRAPASLTKIVTAALAVQLADLDDVVDITVDAYDMPGSSLMVIRPGERYTLRDLLYGMMLRSGNDAALAIGRHLAISDETFVYHMNVLVERLGLENTHFIDPHGLGGRGHYSSAYDLAILARYGMQFPDFGDVVGARTWIAEGSRTIPMNNRNPFVGLYPGADGLKTGFTEAAGPTFIGSAVRDGKRLYVVLLNSSDRWGDAAALLDWAFANHVWPDYTVYGPSEGDTEDGDVISSSTMAIETAP